MSHTSTIPLRTMNSGSTPQYSHISRGQDMKHDEGDQEDTTVPDNLLALKHPMRPTPLMGKVFSLSLDVALVAIAVAFLIFAIVGRREENSLFEDRESTLVEASRILATAFPYTFALIVGRCIQNAISWQLERGINVLSFAYLSQSCTLGGTCFAPLRVRHPHWLPVALFVAWALSPLGSQGLLRFISSEHRITSAQLTEPVHYLSLGATYNASCSSCQAEARAAMLMSIFLSLDATVKHSEDTWGNVKIPLLGTLATEPDREGFWPVADNGTVTYASLIGVPILTPAHHGNLSFTISSWYWQLVNPSYRKNGTKGRLIEGLDTSKHSYEMQNFTGTNQLWQLNLGRYVNQSSVTGLAISLVISYSGNHIDNGDTVPWTYTVATNAANVTQGRSALRLDAVLEQKFVLLQVDCTPLCRVAAIKNVSAPTGYDNSPEFEYMQTNSLSSLAKVFPREHSGSEVPTIFETYLQNPMHNPYRVYSNTINFRGISATHLADRVAQVLNTWWVVENYFTAAAGVFPNVSISNDITANLLNTTVTQSSSGDYLACDYTWLGILCIASLFMILAALVSTTLTVIRVAPDSLDFLSALTRNTGDMITTHGSYIDADDRLRQMKDLVLRIGDAQQKADIGTIMIGPADVLAPLTKDRLYT